MKEKSESQALSRVRLLATPWTAAYQVPLSMDFPGKSTGVGCHFLLQILLGQQQMSVSIGCTQTLSSMWLTKLETCCLKLNLKLGWSL